jgi:NAD(P)-dependent dehydrogenase (short-subunit alcohol dehydrogenase family)
MAAKNWLITGITSGFGRLLAEKLLERGDAVAGTTRKPETLRDLKATYGEKLWLTRLELTDAESCRSAVEKAFHHLGRVDVVVSNAGYGLLGAAEEVTDEQIHHQIETNLVGSIRVIRAALPHLRAQGGGRILQVSASGGQIAFPNFSLYHASKWGIEGFVESIAQEVAPFHIEFTIIEPGGTKTGFAGSAVSAPPMQVYDSTPVGEMRRVIATTGFPLPGNAAKVAQAMIDSVDQHPAPKRLPLGSDTYTLVRAALVERLEALDRQREIALDADADSR